MSRSFSNVRVTGEFDGIAVGGIMNLSELPRVWRTIQHLRWSQIAARLERTSRRRFPMSSAVWQRSTHEEIPACVASHEFPSVPPFRHAELEDESLIELLRDGKFRHLHQTESLGRELPDWRLGVQPRSRLWTITLHYHAWAYQLARIVHDGGPLAAEAEVLLAHYLGDWLLRCDQSVPGAEDLAWNPYAIATRLPAWIRLYFLLQEQFFANRPAFRTRFLSSLYRQAEHLAANLEWDLRANHLLRDAVGLAWVGRFFQGAQARRWLHTATRLAREQVREQVLPDGGHFERSPHYHLEAMHDFLELALLLQEVSVIDELRAKWMSMAEYCTWLRHPDGFCPQLNDSAGVQSAEMLRLGEHLGIAIDPQPRRGGRHFSDTGLVVWSGSRWTLFFDVAEVGPDYQPGHAQADTLTIECSLNEHRLFVDPGCHSYDLDERRQYDRSTAAHNTVCIDDSDSSEVWHIFRVGRRARPRVLEMKLAADRIRVCASHNGYDHLSGSPTHTRALTTEQNGELRIEDLIDGRGIHDVAGGFLLAPEWHAEPTAHGWMVTNGATTARVCLEADRPVTRSIQRRPIHPDYGVEQETNRLAWTHRGELPIRVVVRIEPTES